MSVNIYHSPHYSEDGAVIGRPPKRPPEGV